MSLVFNSLDSVGIHLGIIYPSDLPYKTDLHMTGRIAEHSRSFTNDYLKGKL